MTRPVPVTDEELSDWITRGIVPKAAAVLERVEGLQANMDHLLKKRPPVDDRNLAPGVIRFRTKRQLEEDGAKKW